MTQFPDRPEVVRDVPPQGGVDRRAFLAMGAVALLAGCASGSKTLSRLPGVPWTDRPSPHVPTRRPAPLPESTPAPAAGGVVERARWAKGNPVPTLMDRMLPVRYITVHHDGMRPFYGTSAAAAAERIGLIRRAHRGRSWGDIGYHFIVDREGRVWEGRPLTYQGAHVRDHNEGNIGVMALGNFEEQYPSRAQVEAVQRHVSSLMRRFRVPVSRVRTHQEWAPTACPGRNMQAQVVRMRHNGELA